MAEVYGDAAPDLLRILRNSVTTSRTLVEQKDQLAAALTGTTATVADTAEEFLDDNADRLITLGRVSRPTLALFARYSPEYPCLLDGLVQQEPARRADVQRAGRCTSRSNSSARGPRTDPARNRAMHERSGPDCRGLPNPPVPAHRTSSSTTVRQPTAPAVRCRGRQRRVRHARPSSGLVGSLVAPSWACPADEVPAGRDAAVRPDGPRNGGECRMRSAGQQTAAPLVKFSIFAVVTVLATALLAATIVNIPFTPADTYRAVFSDVTSLEEGDDIRVAGVRVGEVEDIRIKDRTLPRSPSPSPRTGRC